MSTLIDGTRRFDIAVRLPEEFRSSPSAIAAIPIRTAEGAIVPFSSVAKIELDEGYTFVRREALQRYAVLQMDVQGRDVDSFVKDANAAIAAKVKMPTGYWVEWGGAFENQQRAMERLGVIVPLTIGLIFILLYTAFNSVRHATLIIANVPFAIIGGIVGLFITGQYLSVPSAIGFIAVFGVAMLNGIVLVSFLNDQRKHGLSIRDAVRQGAALRLRPVLMTASVAILGPDPDADLDRRRRRDAAPAGHGGDRRADHLDAADPAAAAADLRMVGNAGRGEAARSAKRPRSRPARSLADSTTHPGDTMKEIKAYVHRSRIADVIAALKESPAWGGARGGRRHNLAVYVVKGSLLPLDSDEQHYSMDLGDEVVNEYKLELLCEDSEVEPLKAAITEAARTGQAVAGWITVIDVVSATPIH